LLAGGFAATAGCATAPGARAFTARGLAAARFATLAGRTVCTRFGAVATRGTAASRCALLRGGFLFLAHALVEDLEGLVEAAVDLRAAVIGRDRPGAATVVAACAGGGVTAAAAARIAARAAALVAAGRCRGAARLSGGLA
jgi:hypothetical protein